MPEQLTRQQLYDRIRETSKDEFILSEMKRLGFWKSEEGAPSLSEQLIEREGALYRELQELSQKQRRFSNQQAMLAEMRKARLVASKQKQKETKERSELKRQEKAEKWKELKTKNIVYLGEDVSLGLNQKEANLDMLQKMGLPHFESIESLAEAMKMSVGKLRFLAYNRNISTISHYKRFYITKKTGAKRLISAPMPQLKAAQSWILEEILYKIENTEVAHGFVPKRSILSNAEGHTRKDVVFNLDLKDFFPSIDYKRVKGLFQKFGYSGQIATIFALLCTEAEMDLIEIDGKCYYAAKTERKLPQGAPTSPAISNLICYRLDRRLQGMASKFGFHYTRYADDLSFSASGDAAKLLGQLIWSVAQVVEAEGFVVHPDKLKIMRKGIRQEVTGIVVNEKTSLKREDLRKFRALIHQIQKNGIEGKVWKEGSDLESSMRGFANFVAMVKPEQGNKFKAEINTIFGIPLKKVSKPFPEEANEIEITLSPRIEPLDSSEKKEEDGKSWWEVL